MPPVEMVDALDEAGRPIGTIPRAEIRTRAANFGVVHILLFDRRGRLLIHQLSQTKRFHGAWGASAAGAIQAGETPRAAARRELKEELGVRARVRALGRIRVPDEGVTKFVHLYAAFHDGAPLRPDPAEIAAVEFVSLAELRDFVRSREREFTPAFVSTFHAFERGVVDEEI